MSTNDMYSSYGWRETIPCLLSISVIINYLCSTQI